MIREATPDPGRESQNRFTKHPGVLIMHQVDERTRAALTAAEITPNRVHVTAQLDPPVWEGVKQVLNTLGGSYQKNRSAWAFTFDCRTAVQDVITTGVLRSAAESDGYVPTPDDLAEELTSAPYSDLPRMPAGSRILEPSAAEGAIVRAILDANDEIEVVAIEPHVQRFPHLPHEGQYGGRCTALRTTFEEYAAGAGKGVKFDGVIMNPPFSVPGQPTIWIDHVMLAWNMLEPGGRLVSIVPSGFGYRGDRKTRDLRQLVERFGGWLKLPADTFGGPQACVIWMAQPVMLQDMAEPWLFRRYPEAVEPVPVKYPWLTTRAVQEAPVQVWRDDHTRQDRVLRYRAQCWRCGWLLWEFDGYNDMALGTHATNDSLDAETDGRFGPTVGLCSTCAHTSETYHAAMDVAREMWSKPPTKAASASLWERLVAEGGMVPVSDAERARYAKVQAALRIVFDLPETASEEELIDARDAKPHRGGPDRLAAKYLRVYADRLDPDADLDHLDRAALLWREHPDAPPVALAEEPDPWGPTLTQLEFDFGFAPAN